MEFVKISYWEVNYEKDEIKTSKYRKSRLRVIWVKLFARVACAENDVKKLKKKYNFEKSVWGNGKSLKKVFSFLTLFFFFNFR